MLKSLLSKKPLTIVMVYATWCPHCHTMMPHFDAAAKSPKNTVSAVKINETMMNSVNDYIHTNVNREAKPLRVEGYPSILLVNQKAEKVTDLEPIRDTERMTKIMEESGSLAEEAGLSSNRPPSANLSLNKNSVNRNLSAENVVEDVVNNELENVASNIGSVATNSINIAKNKNKNKNKNKGNSVLPTLNSITQNGNAPSPLPAVTSFNTKNNNGLTPSKKMSQEATKAFSLEAVGSMDEPTEASTVAPSSISDDMESVVISNKLTPAQKLSGGSLLQAMTRTTYTLAPAAALLATAAMVMKRNHRASTHKGRKQKKQKTKKQKKQKKH
jgi:thiol-disulfide isomerase/thioredoxin